MMMTSYWVRPDVHASLLLLGQNRIIDLLQWKARELTIQLPPGQQLLWLAWDWRNMYWPPFIGPECCWALSVASILTTAGPVKPVTVNKYLSDHLEGKSWDMSKNTFHTGWSGFHPHQCLLILMKNLSISNLH